MTDKVKKYLTENRKSISIAVIFLGLVLIMISFFTEKKAENVMQSSSFTNNEIQYCLYLEQRIKTTIESLTGNDTVEVMVTLKNSPATSIAAFENQSTTKTDLLGFNNTQNITKENIKTTIYDIAGVMVIMKRISDSQSMKEIKKAVSTALNISENKIYIIGGAETNEKN